MSAFAEISGCHIKDATALSREAAFTAVPYTLEVVDSASPPVPSNDQPFSIAMACTSQVDWSIQYFISSFEKWQECSFTAIIFPPN
jgi:hypothetical protein